MKQNQSQDTLKQVYTNQFKQSVQSSVDEQRLQSTNNNVGEKSIANKVFIALCAILIGIVIIALCAIFNIDLYIVFGWMIVGLLAWAKYALLKSTL